MHTAAIRLRCSWCVSQISEHCRAGIFFNLQLHLQGQELLESKDLPSCYTCLDLLPVLVQVMRASCFETVASLQDGLQAFHMLLVQADRDDNVP